MNKKTLSIALDASFSFDECLWFLHRNFDDCMHSISSGHLRKALMINNKPLLTDISSVSEALQVEVLSGDYQPEDELPIRAYITEWLDLDRDIAPFYTLLHRDPRFDYMPQEYRGLRLVGIPDLFEALCWGIIGQQINLTFAYRLKRRLVEKYGSAMEYENQHYPIFPTCQVLAGADLQTLRAMQFSNKKAEYMIGLADIFAKGELSKDMLKAMTALPARQKALTAVKGIGIWTANYALMKSLKEPSCIPYGDAGLLQALFSHQVIETKKDARSIEKFFGDFPGWESYLVFYLWRSLSKK